MECQRSRNYLSVHPHGWGISERRLSPTLRLPTTKSLTGSAAARNTADHDAADLSRIALAGADPIGPRDHINLTYQPIADLAAGRAHAAEAIAGWRHPELGDLLPDQHLAARPTASNDLRGLVAAGIGTPTNGSTGLSPCGASTTSCGIAGHHGGPRRNLTAVATRVRDAESGQGAVT